MKGRKPKPQSLQMLLEPLGQLTVYKSKDICYHRIAHIFDFFATFPCIFLSAPPVKSLVCDFPGDVTCAVSMGLESFPVLGSLCWLLLLLLLTSFCWPSFASGIQSKAPFQSLGILNQEVTWKQSQLQRLRRRFSTVVYTWTTSEAPHRVIVSVNERRRVRGGVH